MESSLTNGCALLLQLQVAHPFLHALKIGAQLLTNAVAVEFVARQELATALTIRERQSP